MGHGITPLYRVQPRFGALSPRVNDMLEYFGQLEDVLSETFLGISLGRFSSAFLVIIVSLILKRIIAHFVTKLVYPMAARTHSRYDDQLLESLKRPGEWLIVIAGLFFAVQILQLPVEPIDLRRGAFALLKALVTFSVAWALYNLVNLLQTFLEKWVDRTESTLDDHLLPFIRKSLRGFIIFIAALMTIQNMGYSISGLLASLGIGGLAVALAARDTISNIFGSLMIILDRPFKVGDWIKTGDLEGTVEELGFRSTRIRTFAQTLITVPNNLIANQPIDNISRMPKRRVMMTVGVTYETTPGQIREAVSRIRELLQNHKAVDQEFMLVNFTDFGASSLDILVYCFTTTTVWAEYNAARQDICLKIMDTLEDLGLEIAFPSRSIYMREDSRKALSSPSD